MYRATVRTQIREWLDGIIARPNQEWLIVNLTSGRNAGAKFYQRKGSVVDKIRADFNTGKKDRSALPQSFAGEVQLTLLLIAAYMSLRAGRPRIRRPGQSS